VRSGACQPSAAPLQRGCRSCTCPRADPHIPSSASRLSVAAHSCARSQLSTATSLGPLAGCVHLEELPTGGEEACSNFSNHTPLSGCAKLTRLLILSSQVSDLAPLRGCVKLQHLDVGDCDRLVSLEGLQACSQMERLNMSYLTVSSLGPLSACGQQKDLDIGLCKSVSSLAPLSACGQLESGRARCRQQPGPKVLRRRHSGAGVQG
jgi:Leucine-rich repeat (LRR) protein